LKEILKNVEPYKEEPDFLSNWIKSSKHTSKVNSEEEILRILKTEIKNKKRIDLIRRIYARFAKLRRDREQIELFQSIMEE